MRTPLSGAPVVAARFFIAPVFVLTLMLAGLSPAQPPKGADQPPGKSPDAPKVGVSINEAGALKGYTLIAPLNATKAYLVDMEGRVVKTWDCEVTPGASTYLLDNGNLLRTGTIGSKAKLHGAGAGGRVQEINWAGERVWDFTYSTDTSLQHHDIHRMPNGNILMIVWDKKTAAEAVAAGRRPDAVKDSLMADAIIEVKPTGKTTGEIVWAWHVWDHLVQDFDSAKANYGKVAVKPELVDINFGSGMLAGMMAKKDDADKLRDLGYLSAPPRPGPGGPGGGPSADWTHINSVSYNADLDQIVVSVHAFSEFWIIDHGTTKAEAASHSGGKRGKGGDLLYRWGNPKAYRAGTNADQKLFNQHNAHWIPAGLPGAGNLLVFNNGGGRPGGAYSSVDEIVLPVDDSGNYSRKKGLPFGPDKPTWSYTAEKKTDFFAMLISGAQRLSNGNTLICSGPNSTVFEVTPKNQTVWKFVASTRGMFGGPGPSGPNSFSFTPPGQIMPAFVQDQLKFSTAQKKLLEQLQKEVDEKVDKILTEAQRKQLRELARRPADGPGFGPPGGFGPPPGGFGPPPSGGPPGGGGTPGGLFRSYRYPVDHPGLVGKDLKPGKMFEELVNMKN
jgi:hypothetical protein